MPQNQIIFIIGGAGIKTFLLSVLKQAVKLHNSSTWSNVYVSPDKNINRIYHSGMNLSQEEIKCYSEKRFMHPMQQDSL